MPRIHFTDIAVSALRTPGTYYDDSTPAFGIRVGKNRKTWFVIRGRQRLRTNIGRYPGTTLAEARKEAKKLLLEAPKKNANVTFAAGWAFYKTEHLASRKPRTQADYKRLLNKYFLPRIGTKRLGDLAYEQIVECVQGAAETEAAYALVVCRAFLRWCVRPPRRFLPHSPLEGLQVKHRKARKRVLEPEELKIVWSAAVEQGYPHGTIVQLLIATGQRRGEIANLRWPWINEKEQTITLPDWLTKNHKEHTFPYDGMVSAILATIPRRNSTDLLFPSVRSDERPISGWSKYKRQLKDGVARWRLHDLRRTYRTTHAQLGTPREIGERLINHAAGVATDVELVYDVYKYLPEMRVAVERLERYLEELARS
jgi:integrase